MTLNLQINLLGGLKLVLDDKPVTTVNTQRLQALLAYLLIYRNVPQQRQHVAFLFWPDSPEAQAQSNLRNLLLTLRRTLPNFEDYLSVERQTLQWRNDSHFTLDVAEFEKALIEVEHEPHRLEVGPAPPGRRHP
jgi:DNA-binding SARP family transcriptional activator